MGNEIAHDISQIMRNGTLVDQAMNAAVREAVIKHKQMGLPLVVWRDGKIDWIPPEDVDLDKIGER